MSSCVRSRKPRRKFHHEPTDVAKLSLLLNKGSRAFSTEVKRARKKAKSKAEEEYEAGKGRGRHRSRSRWWHHNSKSKRSQSDSSGHRGKQRLRRSISSTMLLKLKDSIESDNDLNDISFRLGSITYKMDEKGNWKTLLKHSTLKEEIADLAASNLKISQENNMLRVKNELLLDMIAKKNLRRVKVNAELKRLRKLLSSSSSRFSPEDSKS